MIPVEGKGPANQTACQHSCREVNQIDGEDSIACEAKGSFAENPNVQEDYGCADEGYCGDPKKLSYK